MANARIVAWGHYVPQEILDNAFFVENGPYKVHTGEDAEGNPVFRKKPGTDELDLFHQTNEGIIETTGIEQRRRAAPNESVTDFVAEAFRMSGFPARDLDGIIIATISDPVRFPSVASRTQDRIGARTQIGYAADVVAACSGFSHAIEIARLRVQENGGHYLVAGVEILSRAVDDKERNYILFGDGCGLVVVGPSNEEGSGILGTHFVNDSSGVGYIYRDRHGTLRMPEGNKVYKMAVRGMVDVAHGAMGRAGITKGEVDFYVPHQANERIVTGVEKIVDPEKTGKVIRNIQFFGNMSTATEPVAYSMARTSGKIKEGDVVVWTDMGAGLAYGSIVERV